MKNILLILYPPIILLLVLGLTAEAFVHFDWVPAYLLPAPSQVLAAAIEFGPDLRAAFLGTARATAQGLLISLVTGQAFALILNLSDFARRSLFPLAVFFQTVPIIAVAPLLVIWFGFGEPTVRASAAIVCFFPILSNAMVGLDSARREYKELFKLIGASRAQTLIHLQIPSSFRTNFAGLRVAAGLAVVGALVGELIGGGGLGALIDSARSQQRTDLVFACVVLSTLLGLVFVSVVFLLQTLLLKWRPYDEA